MKLFDRSTRQVLLTREGERFLVSARRLAKEFDAFENAMRNTSEALEGHVSVAMVPSLVAGWLPQVLEQFLALHPGVSVSVLDMHSEPCLDALERAEADFALTGLSAESPLLESTRFFQDSFSLVCPTSHPLATQDTIGLDDLQHWPTVRLAGNNRDSQHIEASLFPEATASRIEVHAITSAIGLVRAGLGICVLPSLVFSQLNTHDLTVRPLPQSLFMRTIFLTCPRHRSLPLAAQSLLSVMQSMCPPTSH